MSDFKQRFSFEALDVRGCVARIEQTCEWVQSTRHYPASVRLLLNEFTLAAILLRDSLKGQSHLSLQLRSSGALSLLVADCMQDARVRAIAQYDAQRLPSTRVIDLHNLSKDATLTITITPKEGSRYQSIVPLAGGTLAECLHQYFCQSEQLASRFVFFSRLDSAVAISLHRLPLQYSVSPIEAESDFERVRTLLDTLSEQEAFDLDTQTILTRLFHHENCVLYPEQPVHCGCICSKEKSLHALKTLGQDELDALIEERKQQGDASVNMDCHFCNQQYKFDFDELAEIRAAH